MPIMAGGNGVSKSLEFGGKLGASCLVLGLPVAVVLINLACNKDVCALLRVPSVPEFNEFFDFKAAILFVSWFSFQLFLSILPTGKVVSGSSLASGGRLDYRCNGFMAFIMSVAAFVGLALYGVPVTYAYQKFLALMTTAILFSFLLGAFLYVKSFSADHSSLAHGGNTGIFIYDFFLGRELNPRIGPVDLKFFCELRPGLIGWVMLDLSFIAEAWRLYGSLSPALVVVVAFHILYVADALWHEEAILTTMDIVHDGFGLMLAFGDLAWVPFLYCLQARFILEHPQDWSLVALAAVVVLNMIGFVIFRGSNSQKDEFRRNPNSQQLKHLKTLPTSSGTKLLISGWWGMSRHPNYMGDLIMALSWSLVTGFQHLLPYFYPIYFLGLLIHRSQRDDAHCRRKYATDWDKYCKLVPYRIFPYVF